MSLIADVESLLFVSPKPLSVKKVSELTKQPAAAVEEALTVLQETYSGRDGGIVLAKNGMEYQFLTAPAQAALVQAFLKDDATGDLTRPSLETLTIIAYRGPVTKAEIEQIRGVNCSLILRNLLIRGLISAEEDPKTLLSSYRVTMDFLRFLGVASVEQLPDYERLRADRALLELLTPVVVAPPQGTDSV
jgi:segregation and condensation protein B